ncbi:muconolactone delta-isomerase [Rhodococcus opacus M213]|uniref:Muconolactone delta-isomerase n=1 Tax=Rhodococcus opacus M213 TaxID=1129896 RepID=K8XU94_RHOOP|nr:muconolactone Delta-isomerase family protein [Rhodococcus opacus]EKT81742.1 muconolactone delta-isomerase [Rhodococcus opacus M213]
MSTLTFLVNHLVERPTEIHDHEWDTLVAQEREIATERVRRGVLAGLWRVPGRTANWGLWRVCSAEELHELLTSLPLAPWSTFDVHLLARHPLMEPEDT